MSKQILSAVLAMGLIVTSFNTFAADPAVEKATEQVKTAIKVTDAAANAKDAFYLLDNATVIGHQAAMRAEYMYLTALYADLLLARSMGDVATFITEGIGAPELVTKLSEQGATMVVLWSPAAIATASEVASRFKRLGYVLPQFSPLIKETITLLDAYREGFRVSNGSATVHYEKVLKATKDAALRIGKIGGATAINYTVVVGAFYLSSDAISFTAAPRAEIVAAQKEIEARMKQLREELPEVQMLDYLMSQIGL